MTDLADTTENTTGLLAARHGIACLWTGVRQIPLGPGNNPFLLTLARAGSTVGDDDGPRARGESVWVRAPLERSWRLLCGTDDEEVAVRAAARLLEHLPERAKAEAAALAGAMLLSRIAAVRAKPAMMAEATKRAAMPTAEPNQV
jgi:hypothetical protein